MRRPLGADRLPLGAVSSAPLAEAMHAWHQIVGPDGRFHIGRDGTEQTIWGVDPLSGGRTYLLVIDPQVDLANWRIVRNGNGHIDQSGLPFICSKLGDFPWSDVQKAANPTLIESVTEMTTTLHRIYAPGDNGGQVAYDVVRFPIFDAAGRLVRLLTKSHVYFADAGG